MSEISLEYAAALERADSLRIAADECSANRSRLQAQINAVTAGLEGAAGSALLNKLYAWRAENDALESALRAASGKLSYAAETIHQADLAAAAAMAAEAAAQAQAQAQAQAAAQQPAPASAPKSHGGSFTNF